MTQTTYVVEDEDMNAFKKLLCKMFNIGCPVAPTGPTAPTGPVPVPSGQYFGYFGGYEIGVGSPTQFADHCNVLFISSWGDWVSAQGRTNLLMNCIDQIQAGVVSGINRAILNVDWCLFDPQFHPLPDAIARAYLKGYFDNLNGLHLLQYVTAFYVIDEPDVNGVSDSAMTAVNARLRSVMSGYPELAGKPLATVYGVNGTPGLASFDWAGFDNYGTPIFSNGEYNNFVAKLAPVQRTIIVPGGANPWQDNPAPFGAKAASDPRVVWIMPFMWFDAGGGNGGIDHNGMAPQYRAVGLPIRVANP